LVGLVVRAVKSKEILRFEEKELQREDWRRRRRREWKGEERRRPRRVSHFPYDFLKRLVAFQLTTVV
jgi:hypothetical protein